MFNKKVLAMATAALNKAKAPAKKKDIIVDPRGQWDHPGEVTRIPGNEITMQGVPYPVYGVDNTGYGQMMYPGQNYTFPGDYVDEYPQMQRGGVKPYVTSDIDDFKFRQAAYNDSLWLYNKNRAPIPPPNRGNYINAFGQTVTSAAPYTVRTFSSPTHRYTDRRQDFDFDENGNIINRRSYYYNPATIDYPQDRSPYFGPGIPANRPIRYDIRESRWKPRITSNPFTGETYQYYLPWQTREDDDVVQMAKARFKKPVQPVRFVRPGSTQTNFTSDYEKKHPPIYLSDPNDPRIGSYTEAGNQYLYKPVAPKTNPQLEILNLPTKPLSTIPSSLPEQQIIPFVAPKDNRLTILDQKDVPRTMRVPVQGTETYYVTGPNGQQIPKQRPVTTYQEVPWTDERAGKVTKYDLKSGSYKQTGGAKATCPEGYTYDAASNTCIPTGEFEYVEDPNDPRLEDYRMQDILYRYSQLPYKQKDFVPAKDILSGDFSKAWNNMLNDPDVSDEDKAIYKNDLLGWENSKAQLWNFNNQKQLQNFINSPVFTWTPELDYSWRTNNDLQALLKKYPPAGYQAREFYSSYPYQSAYTYNPNIPERPGYKHYIKPNTTFIEDEIDREKLKKIYPTLTDEEINEHIKNTRESPSYITNYQDSNHWPIYNADGETREDQVHPPVKKIPAEKVNDPEYSRIYEGLPKQGAESYLQDTETDQVTYEGEYIPTWLAPKKKYILRTALPTPVIETPKEPVVEQPAEEEGLKIVSEKDVPRTMRRPVQSTETYYVKGPTGQLIPKQRPVTTYEEVPWTDERAGEATEYDLNTGSFKKKKGGSVKSSKYSRSIEATNKLFHENKLTKKQKSKKKKIYDPYAKYFQEGGVPYNYNPLVSNEPEGIEIPMPFNPQRTLNDPEDYNQFLSYSETAPENRRPDENYFYGNPDQYDHYGMWEALGKPKNFEEALQINPWWEPDPYDNMYHGFSVNPNTGVFLKSGKPGETKPGDTTWMEIAGHYQGRDAQNYTPVFDPELQRFKYIPNKEKGGFQDDINKRRRVLTDWTYGKDLGLNQAQKGLAISDLNEYKYRKGMYNDSLALYNAYNLFQNTLKKPSQNIHSLGDIQGRNQGWGPKILPGNPYSRVQPTKYYTYYQDKQPWQVAKYKKPVQPVYYKPNVEPIKNTDIKPVEKNTPAAPITLKTKPAELLPVNLGTQEIIPQTWEYKMNTKPGIVLPESREEWKTLPGTGTPYRVQRPVDPRFSPKYNPATGSYQGGGTQDTYATKDLREVKVTAPPAQWVQDQKKFGKDKISWWEAPFNWKKWGLNDYSDYSSFNSAFRNARESGEKEFVYKGERYNTKLIDPKQSDIYWKSKEFVKNYYKDQPISEDRLREIMPYYSNYKYGTNWDAYYDKVKDTPEYNDFTNPRNQQINDSLDMLWIKADDPEFLKYAKNNQYRGVIKDLYKPSYFSITDFKPSDMRADGYWDPKNNKTFMVTNADPGKLQTTYVHELSHKADDYLDILNKVPEVDIDALNKSAFRNDFTQADFDYVSEPSEVEARKLSTLFYLSEKGRPYKPGKITMKHLDKLYDEGFANKLPYDIEQLLMLYGAQRQDLLDYLNSNYKAYKK